MAERVPFKDHYHRGFSPCKLVTGQTVDFNKDYTAEVRTYIEASTDVIVTNNQKERTRSCIVFGPDGNW